LFQKETDQTPNARQFLSIEKQRYEYAAWNIITASNDTG